MNLQEIEDLLESYGFEFILTQHDLNELMVLSILNDLGYVDLEHMGEEE
jgi:hypothetical protein